MNEIEKLYENAGIVPKKNCYYWDCPYSTGNVAEDAKKEKDCENCNNPDKKTYPPFTAEKQLEIVKLILFSTWWLNLKRLQFSEKFDKGLAQIINDIWQDLTEEERKQIRDILAR